MTEQEESLYIGSFWRWAIRDPGARAFFVITLFFFSMMFWWNPLVCKVHNLEHVGYHKCPVCGNTHDGFVEKSRQKKVEK